MLFVQACKPDEEATQGRHTSVSSTAHMMAAMAGWCLSLSCNLWHWCYNPER